MCVMPPGHWPTDKWYRLDIWYTHYPRPNLKTAFQNPCEASSRSRIFLNSLGYVFVCLFLSRLLAKQKTIQTWNLAHILPLTLSKTVFFFVFRSNQRDGRYPRKTAMSRGISAYLLDCLVFFFTNFFSPETSKFNKAILERHFKNMQRVSKLIFISRHLIYGVRVIILTGTHPLVILNILVNSLYNNE